MNCISKALEEERVTETTKKNDFKETKDPAVERVGENNTVNTARSEQPDAVKSGRRPEDGMPDGESVGKKTIPDSTVSSNDSLKEYSENPSKDSAPVSMPGSTSEGSRSEYIPGKKTGTEKAGEDKEEINPFDYPGTERVRIRHLEMRQISQEDIDRVLQLTGQLEAFEILMMYYGCALAEVRTKLEVLNKEVTLKKNRNPFETIKSRLKKPVSIYEKLKLRRIPFSVENIEKYLTDVAGLRVICSFIDDIYNIRDSLAAQDDVRIIQEKDYIAHPKPNGYRSLHLILEIPIFLMQEKKYMHVELQFRTIAMDFWASVEHTMKYKKEIKNADSIVEELRYSADLINQLDRRMLQIRDRIEMNESTGERSQWV